MKTTVHIADALFQEAKRVASEEKTSLRALVDEGLRLALERRRGDRKPFKLKDCSSPGGRLRPEWEGRSFQEILDFARDPSTR